VRGALADNTDVNWECEFTPSLLGNVFCCCGGGLVCIITLSFKKMLSTLKHADKVE
jgi:hypothetical protein